MVTVFYIVIGFIALIFLLQIIGELVADLLDNVDLDLVSLGCFVVVIILILWGIVSLFS